MTKQSREMPGLLVSVRDRHEARLAVEAGVDLIDVKEPLRGSLGRPDVRTLTQIRATITGGVPNATNYVERNGASHRPHKAVFPRQKRAASAATLATIGSKVDGVGRIPVSVALGELADCDPKRLRRWARHADFAKLGLAGCCRKTDWQALFMDAYRRLARCTQPVAVIYGDWPTTGAPSPSVVLDLASRAGCRWLLVDTFDKSRGGLLDQMSVTELRELVERSHRSGFRIVVAGSLSIESIPIVSALGPDLVAVRGAVCGGDRRSQLDPARLHQLCAVMSRAPSDNVLTTG